MEYEREERRRPEVIIPIIIILILIIALFCLGFYAYNLKLQLAEAEAKNSGAANEENDIDFSSGENLDEEAIELSKDDDIVKTLIQKIDFPTHAIASIYGVESFNLSTIQNDLILRLAWAKVDKELVKDNTGKYKQTASITNFEECVAEIFGTKVNYINNSFTNINVPAFHGYYKNLGVINYNGDSYTAEYSNVGGKYAPFIHQEVDKVLKYDNRIELYVKTAFVDTKYSDYIIYKNFSNDKFEEKVLELTASEFSDSSSDKESNSSFVSNSKISDISSELNSYVYTFILSEEDENYYLRAFNKAE